MLLVVLQGEALQVGLQRGLRAAEVTEEFAMLALDALDPDFALSSRDARASDVIDRFAV